MEQDSQPAPGPAPPPAGNNALVGYKVLTAGWRSVCSPHPMAYPVGEWVDAPYGPIAVFARLTDAIMWACGLDRLCRVAEVLYDAAEPGEPQWSPDTEDRPIPISRVPSPEWFFGLYLEQREQPAGAALARRVLLKSAAGTVLVGRVARSGCADTPALAAISIGSHAFSVAEAGALFLVGGGFWGPEIYYDYPSALRRLATHVRLHWPEIYFGALERAALDFLRSLSDSELDAINPRKPWSNAHHLEILDEWLCAMDPEGAWLTPAEG